MMELNSENQRLTITMPRDRNSTSPDSTMMEPAKEDPRDGCEDSGNFNQDSKPNQDFEISKLPSNQQCPNIANQVEEMSQLTRQHESSSQRGLNGENLSIITNERHVQQEGQPIPGFQFTTTRPRPNHSWTHQKNQKYTSANMKSPTTHSKQRIGSQAGSNRGNRRARQIQRMKAENTELKGKIELKDLDISRGQFELGKISQEFHATMESNANISKILNERDAEIVELKRTIESGDVEISRQRSKLDNLNHEFDRRMESHKNDIVALGERDEEIEMLNARIHQLEMDIDLEKAKLQKIIRNQQNESFKRIDSARWISRDDEAVKLDLDRLKRLMTAVATKYAIAITKLSDISWVGDLVSSLRKFIKWENDDEFLKGVKISKVPSMVLNGLLAHKIFMDVIGRPFFFSGCKLKGSNAFEKTYQFIQNGNEKEAHKWRAQTLRVQFPKLNPNSSVGDIEICTRTDKKIVQAAEHYAEQFFVMASPLIDLSCLPEAREKVKEIFVQAARLSYELWTRNTIIGCYTFQNFENPLLFDMEDVQQEPHALVRWEDYKNRLKGNPIKMITSPLVMVCGNDDCEDYDQGRVWSPMEVWLPNPPLGEEDIEIE